MAKKKNPCKFILLKTGEELNFDQARDFLFKNYDFNTKTLKSESYAVQVEEEKLYEKEIKQIINLIKDNKIDETNKNTEDIINYLKNNKIIKIEC